MSTKLEKTLRQLKQKWAKWNAKWAAASGEREEYISRTTANRMLGDYLTRKKAK